ncbi:hypothetical protein ACJJTC_017472 [Scirpophaga incertulas]
MLPASTIVTFNILFTVLSENVQIAALNHAKEEKSKALQTILGNVSPVPVNITYIERGENILRMPNLQSNDDVTPKKKLTKKSPRSRIQKIIKKNKSRRKLISNEPITNKPLMSGDEMDNYYAKEELAQKNENSSGLKGLGRSTEKDDRDLYVLTDLDDIEFLKEDKDEDIVKAHVKNYW